MARRVKKKKYEVQIVRKHYYRREPSLDVLKYWRIIRRTVCRRNKLREPELDMLLFLYSEGLFNYYKFVEYGNFFGWDRKRFLKLREGGWIHLYRDKMGGEHRLYEVTRKCRYMLTEMYKNLNFQEEICTIPAKNPIFRRETYSDKILALGILKFNEEVRKQRVPTSTVYDPRTS
jgi:hypothetical protein